MNNNHEASRIAWGKYPSVRVAILLGAGIAAGRYCAFAWAPLLMAALAVIALSLLLQWWHRRLTRPLLKAWITVSYMGALLLFGAFWQSWNSRELPGSRSSPLEWYEWENLTFYGRVFGVMPRTPDKWHLDVAVDSALLPSGLMLRGRANMRLIAYPDELGGLAGPASGYLGEYWAFSGRLYPLEPPTNPYEFDYKRYLNSIDIEHQAGLNYIVDRTPLPGRFNWLWLRKKVLQAIDGQYAEEARPLARALLIGEKSGLDREEKLAFSRAGLSHIMAVSGLHVGFLIFPVWLLIPWFWHRASGRIFMLALLAVLLLGYAGITQFSASVCRAGIMALLLAYAKLYKRGHQSLNLMAFAAVLLLLADPGRLFEIGFQLSFGAVTAIILLWPAVQGWLPEGWQSRWYGKLAGVMGISLVVQLSLFPLLVSYFGEFSLIGPMLNALVIPVIGVALPAALFAIPLHYLMPAVAGGVAWLFAWVLRYLSYLAGFSSSMDWGWVAYYPPYPVLLLLCWLAALGTLVLWWHRPVRWKWASLALSLLLIWQLMAGWETVADAKLRLTVFDVGQGDAVLIRMPNGSTLLVDTGPGQQNYSPASAVLLPYVQRNNIKKLDGILLSHPHTDHIGGVVPLMESIEVDTIFTSGLPVQSDIYQDYRRVARESGVPVKRLSRGDRIPMDPSVSIRILSPPRTYEGMDENSASLVLLVSYGETGFMFTGDVEAETERELVACYDTLLDVDFLKVAHHGSSSGSLPAFLRITSPEWAAVSLAWRNRFGHPGRETSARLKRYCGEVAFTSLDGALHYESDGQKIVRLQR